jgi:endonuclease-3
VGKDSGKLAGAHLHPLDSPLEPATITMSRLVLRPGTDGMARVKQADTALKSRASRVVKGLARAYPDVTCALEHRNAFELLTATILSAQCTDKRVNQVTPVLFARFPDARAMARAEQAEVETLIYTTGFFRAKAKSLIGMAQRMVELHGGEVPPDLDAMTALPGVGRKTANVVLGTAFGLATGVVVDTHVKRLTRRMGLTTSSDPKIIERELMAIVARKHWIDLSHRLIAHGRRVCIARRPRCGDCSLAAICPKIGVVP